MQKGKNILVYYLFVLVSVLLIPANANETQEKTIVYQFSIDQEIMPAAWRTVQKAFKEANEKKADYILLILNTYGGQLDIADSIRTKFLKSTIPTFVFINNNAASAGALISIACDSIYMHPSATIGAATVVNQTGEQMPDKYQSYMRGIMRATAEAKNRDPKIAEAMVDDRVKITGIIDSGKVLTFTTSEAIKNNFCDAEVTSVDEALSHAGITNYNIAEYTPSSIDRLIQLLLNPALNGILLLIIIGGIYFELQSPGVGFPIIASAIAAILYFAPLYLEGLAANWEILVFILGVGLIIVELFVIPGFGIAGISGLILVFGGLMLSMIGNHYFDFTFTIPSNVTSALVRLSISIIALFVFPLIINQRSLSNLLFKRIALVETLSNTSQEKENMNHLVGKSGIAINDLRTSGMVKVDDQFYDAVTDGEYIEKEASVLVTGARNSTLIVSKG